MKLLRASIIALAAIASTSAFADPVVFQTAAFTDYSSTGEPGGYFIDSTRYIGAAFTLTQATNVSAIGGYFSTYSSDTIFGAIVPLASLASMPANIATTSLAHVVFTPTGTDETDALSVRLNAGTYAVVFGSGLFGATGNSALVSGQDGNATHLFSGVGSTYSSFTDGGDLRLTVEGTVAAVPEPQSLAMLAAGLLAVGRVMRGSRRRG